jgi:hypothetical protein
VQIEHNQKFITNTSETKFLGLIINDTLTWTHRIEHLCNKKSSACYALRYVKHSLPVRALKITYFANVHTIMSYSVIFCGNSSYANKVFIMQKKIEFLQIHYLGTLAGIFLGVCKYLPFTPSTYTL